MHGPRRAALSQAFGCARVVFNDALSSAGGTGTPDPGAARRSRNPPRRSADRGRAPRPSGRGAELSP
ncbi:helix-turn-helix domain-containing protein [Streptomyces sp. NPDC048428]|uniref:helix-turn-helix domain-containing protein n=1 Tax=Streptomyces sp. NPDC048428 TaxID=3154503 RepID=UPI00342AB0EA